MNRETLTKIIPEFNLIQDTQLRENCIAVWEEAANYRNWTEDELLSIPFTLLAENVKITYLEHVRTVCQMCVACDKVLTEAYGDRKTPVNRDYLVAGALLADVGKLYEYDKKDGKVVKSKHGEYLRHPFSGVGLCFKYHIPEEVMHIVAVHSREGDHFKRSPEAIILHHADFIDFDLVK
ncbi:HD domain-containing protein [candidate division KSB1 bacterium]|nr:HD domain-containing protein [candidate division KSB1 bacterium]